MKIKAFTLTELLIALAVIGVLIAILMPIIFGLMPNQNVLMAKRAYYGIQTIVGDLLNNEACYPNRTLAASGEERSGFDDGYGYADCTMWGGQHNTSYINTEDANSKFLTLFVNKLDLKSDLTDNSVILNGATQYSFTTKDGIVWTAENMRLAVGNADPSIEFLVDLNGPDGPNCRSASDTGCSDKKDFDRFKVKIRSDGKIGIIDNWAAKAVGINADIR